MPANTDLMKRSIEPGSIDYGQRQAFEQRLGAMNAQLPAELPGVAQGAPGVPVGNLGPPNPLDPLVSGELPADADPLTSGLSVGPGPGAEPPPPADPLVSNLRAISLYARSPVLRELARRALRTTVRTSV